MAHRPSRGISAPTTAFVARPESQAGISVPHRAVAANLTGDGELAG